jgi:hypothetical protein
MDSTYDPAEPGLDGHCDTASKIGVDSQPEFRRLGH